MAIDTATLPLPIVHGDFVLSLKNLAGVRDVNMIEEIHIRKQQLIDLLVKNYFDLYSPVHRAVGASATEPFSVLRSLSLAGYDKHLEREFGKPVAGAVRDAIAARFDREYKL